MKRIIPHLTGWLAIAMLAGCEADPATGGRVDGPSIVVRYDAKPLADVVVRLHTDRSGPVLDQAITDATGLATFTNLPSPEPAAYEVSLMSASDGGWMMNPKVTERFTADLRLKPFVQNDAQTIELPRGSVQTL